MAEHSTSWTSERRRATGTVEVPPDRQQELLRDHRPATVVLAHAVHGTATLRDQHPLNLKMLERTLTDMTVADWLEQLNRHVFFAPTKKRLESLYAAYADRSRLVLTIDTNSRSSPFIGTRYVSHGSTPVPFDMSTTRAGGTRCSAS